MEDRDIGDRLSAFMKKKGLNQESIAEKAGVSQPSVCRALKAKSGRVGPAQEKIFRYAMIDEYIEPHVDDPRDHVLVAFDRIWDGSVAHAKSIAMVIGALADLRPKSRNEKDI